MQLNSVLFLVSTLVIAYPTLVWSICDCPSDNAGCFDKCINAARNCMADCNIKAASKNSDANGCYNECMAHYWPQPYDSSQEQDDNQEVEPEENQEEDEVEAQSEMLDDEALEEEESNNSDNGIYRMAEPDQVFDQEVTQEEDQAASDQDNFNNLVLAAAAVQDPEDGSTVAEAYHDDDDDHHQQPSSVKGDHPIATVTAYTTSHVTVMPDGQPLPSNGQFPSGTSDASKVAALFSSILPMLMVCMFSLFI
ncbi:hypothetical protein K492DRAFT_194402 [Lichtheimia hyalospora FSU 10163]|nr:hypothetical protein K492DRAFT_194402 [Lichtheimia hyalospora FSU 10163]